MVRELCLCCAVGELGFGKWAIEEIVGAFLDLGLVTGKVMGALFVLISLGRRERKGAEKC